MICPRLPTTALSDDRRQLTESIINLPEPDEGELYDMVNDRSASSANLLHVRRVFKFNEPIPVSRLVKISDAFATP